MESIKPAVAPSVRHLPLRVVLADDHEILRRSLAFLLGKTGNVTVVASVGDGSDAVEATEHFAPDVVLMDIEMPQLDGISATRLIHERFPATRVAILTAFDDGRFMRRAIDAGASGFITKTSDIAELNAALSVIVSGNLYVSHHLAEHFDVRGVLFGSQGNDLTDREGEVTRLVAEGCSTRQAAEALAISVKTVENHLAHIRQKVGARNRADLVRFAVASGLVVAGLPARPCARLTPECGSDGTGRPEAPGSPANRSGRRAPPASIG